MEIIGKISKGSKMDQIYIPKNRHGFPIGNYVLITPISSNEVKTAIKPFFYGIKDIEPLKMKIINEVFETIDKKVDDYKNIIITGSFLEKGFCFNDLDVILLTGKEVKKDLKENIEDLIGVKIHLIILSNDSLIEGLSTDPLYQSMLSKCVTKNRIVYDIKPKINYKLLDLHLYKSKVLIDNFDILSGSDKYYHVQNLIGISLFLHSKKVSKDMIDDKIKESFGISKIEIKQNLLEKKDFIKNYKEIYDKTFEQIMENIKDGTK